MANQLCHQPNLELVNLDIDVHTNLAMEYILQQLKTVISVLGGMLLFMDRVYIWKSYCGVQDRTNHFNFVMEYERTCHTKTA